ncbi:MAG: hypothetical protein C0432_00145 [Candidatus Puniceispirillum sp.]|nr:hypothetical protein [Candidatus Pelagibacter sp.]MBA4282693.1 hypothetical protein [Candidatus Puniceispirillum sp.]
MKNKFHFQNIATLTIAMMTLSACDSVKKTFGFDHYQPDEMNVIDNPPLSLPPCYDLRPPEKKETTTSVSSANNHNQKALQVIAGNQPHQKQAAAKAVSTQALVKKASLAHNVDKDIKEKISEDEKLVEEKKSLSGVGKKMMDNITNLSNDEKDTQK